MIVNLMQGDCLERMKSIPGGCVDMILCDLPYGTTNCKWDNIIPFEPLWEQYLRVAKHNAAIVLLAAQPFATDLINSRRDLFRYDLIYEKTLPVGFLNAKRMPLRAHEIICVFYRRLPTYNPQKSKAEKKKQGVVHSNTGTAIYGNYKHGIPWEDSGMRMPTSVIRFSNQNGRLFGDTKKNVKHPTAKPVPLIEYLIRTYTNEGETVLDNCMGSGTTGVACVNTGRNFIGIELDPGFYSYAEARITEARARMTPSPTETSKKQDAQISIFDLAQIDSP